MTEKQNQLEQILNAREQRWNKRQAYAAHWPALLSMTLCIPQPLRGGSQAGLWFQQMCRQVLEFLEGCGLHATVLERDSGPDGPLLMAGFSQSPRRLKEACVQAEQTLPGGRLLDLDVTAHGGDAVSRRDLGLPPRQCFLCGRPAVECASRGLHPREQVLQHVQAWLDQQLR